MLEQELVHQQAGSTAQGTNAPQPLLYATASADPALPSPPPESSARRRQRSRRPIWPLVVLLIVVIVGGVSYVSAGLLGVPLPGFRGATQGPVTTTAVNTSVTYASVQISVLNVQQASSFSDDPQDSVDGIARIHLRETNSSDSSIVYNLYQSAHLLIPGRGEQAPLFVKVNAALAPHSTRSNVLDFAAPPSFKPAQLTLRLGSDDEAQMDVPLSPAADLSRYQPRSFKLNQQAEYFGLNWTLAGATEEWSSQGQQAPRGKRFLTLTLKVENTLAQTAITGSPYDYMRLQAAGTSTMAPLYATLPVSFAQGVTDASGTVTFAVPEQSSSFTLLLQFSKNSGMESASLSFQIKL